MLLHFFYVNSAIIKNTIKKHLQNKYHSTLPFYVLTKHWMLNQIQIFYFILNKSCYLSVWHTAHLFTTLYCIGKFHHAHLIFVWCYFAYSSTINQQLLLVYQVSLSPWVPTISQSASVPQPAESERRLAMTPKWSEDCSMTLKYLKTYKY